MTRREQIEAMLADDPQDVFLRYTLAMEYRSEDRNAESLALYRDLMSESPPHVPSHFRAAQLLVDDGEIEDAREILRHGIELAREQDDSHTAAEMSELLQMLGELGE